MYCVDYQMSYPLLVVPYAPLSSKLKVLILNRIRTFFYSLKRRKHNWDIKQSQNPLQENCVIQLMLY